MVVPEIQPPGAGLGRRRGRGDSREVEWLDLLCPHRLHEHGLGSRPSLRHRASIVGCERGLHRRSRRIGRRWDIPLVGHRGFERVPPAFGASSHEARARRGIEPLSEAANSRRGALPPDVSHSGELQNSLRDFDYLSDEGLSTAIFLALKLGRPLFLEGEAGVGKTEVAKVLSSMLSTPMIRLQCYEGIDVYQALYEWDYPRQLLHIRATEALGKNEDRDHLEKDLYGREFLVSRPLLQALEHHGDYPPVLLIDEVDRADDEFEAFLLEILSDYSVTIPELGTIHAERPPVVIITSNRTREVHDALKRRCLYFWIEHPNFDREVEIVRLRIPGTSEELARQVAGVVQEMRSMDLYKPPGVAETLDWTEALVALGAKELDESLVEATLGSVVKYREDQQRVKAPGIEKMLSKVDAGGWGVSGV
ncbi:MAG: MoxR family ATPase [Rubrobacter sp.]|nr:MoxR family ATPase [Rubrobacter sp.]